ncbi:MAG: hypothetical protein WEA35_09475 [Candidatus Nanopelagicales bacterium]
MSSAQSTGLGSLRHIVVASLGRVLGVDPAGIRDDTPLALLGWDALARVCLADLLAESGVLVSVPPGVPAATVGDLIGAATFGAAT